MKIREKAAMHFYPIKKHFLYWFIWILLSLSMLLFSGRVFKLEYTIAFLILLLSLFIARKNPSPSSHLNIFGAGYILPFCLAFIPRLIYCIAINPYIKQYDDFAIVLEEAASASFTDRLSYYSIYAHKIYYPLILHTLNLRSQIGIFIFQCVLCGMVCVVIFQTCSRVFGCAAGKIGAFLYAFWPGQIIYTAITTEEHLAALLAVLIVFGLLWIIQKTCETPYVSYSSTLLIALLTGVTSGCIAFFKDWGMILLIAFLITGIWLLFHYTSARQRVTLLIFLVILFLSRIGTQEAMSVGAKHIIGTIAGNSVIIAEMFTTLDPNTSGSYNEQGDAEYEQIVIKNHGDYSKANQEAMSILWQRIRKDIYKMPSHLLKKGTESYADDSSMLYWALRLGYVKESENEPASLGIRLLWEIARLYYSYIIVVIIIGCLVKPQKSKFFLMLSMIGSLCVGLLVESQGRYKYSIEPCWAILAAVCFQDLIQTTNIFFLRKIPAPCRNAKSQ